MKVLFVNPAERRVLRSNLPKSIEELRGKNPPISILYAAGVARTVDGWETSLIDVHAEDLDDRGLHDRIAAEAPDLVGITATTFTYLDSLDAARIARQAHPACRVLFGGVQPFVYPRETLAQPEVDLILSGEAETSLPRLLELWRDEGFDAVRGESIPGVLVDGDDPEGFRPADVLCDLDAAPMPAWDLSPMSRYGSLVTDRSPVNIMITSRGCPFRCRYCALSPTGKKWRAHSPERVVEEMKTCVGLGARYLLFYDETFAVRKQRVFDICEAIRREGIDVPWMARATPGTTDDSVLAAMRDAGCDMVTFGVESGSPEILEKLGRRQEIEEIVEAFRAAHRAGLRTIAYFMIGSPGETRAHVRRSLKLAARLNAELVHASLFTAYPSSAIYQDALDRGAVATDYWHEFAAHPTPDFEPPQGNEFLDEKELQATLIWFYRRYSFRPAYILRRLLGLRSLSDMARAWKGMRTLLAGFEGQDSLARPD